MLMDISCSAVTSIRINLSFDNGMKKTRVVGTGDLIFVEFNQNGKRIAVEGKILKVSASGSDPKTWSIILDGSGDFASEQYRFSPLNILDLEILKKEESLGFINTPNDYTGIANLRIVDGYLQYSKDGITWHTIKNGRRDDMNIKPEEGTCHGSKPHHHHCDCIKDENSDEDVDKEFSTMPYKGPLPNIDDEIFN